MFPLIGLTTGITILVGLILKFWLDAVEHRTLIKWSEFWLTVGVASIVIIPLTAIIGWKTAINNQLTFNEYWNGWEQQAQKEVITCHRDGSCRWTYQCDPYVICHPVCTSNGKSTSCTTVCNTYYHSCPYCTEEWSYSVQTTLGFFALEQNRFPDNPVGHTWRWGESPSAYIIADAGVGDPPFWLQVKARLDSGFPGPVSDRRTYKNYILASHYTILKQYKGDIKYYMQHNLMPLPPTRIIDPYLANKVTFVGYHAPDFSTWQKYLMYLNAELGHGREGDLFLIVTQSNVINQNPDQYAIALKAYWQSPSMLQDNAVSQNTIIVIVGTDGNKVTWARATTGMPIGNEGMTQRIQSVLTGTLLSPDSVIGVAKLETPHTMHVTGGIAQVVLSDSTTAFHRTKMETYLYLKNEIEPTHSAKIWIGVIATILACLCWLAPIIFEENQYVPHSYSTRHSNYYYS